MHTDCQHQRASKEASLWASPHPVDVLARLLVKRARWSAISNVIVEVDAVLRIFASGRSDCQKGSRS